MNYIFKNEKILGPFDDVKIIELIDSQTLKINDFVFSEGKWNQVYKLELVKKHYHLQPPTIKPNQENIIKVSEDQIKNLQTMNTTTQSDFKIPKSILDKEWFILRSNKKYGPFKYLDIVKMLNSKSLFDHDYIWNNDFKSWNKISDLKAYSSYYINQVKSAYLPELGNIFFRRKYKRIKCNANVFLHNDEQYWSGIGNNLSPEGLSITLKNKFGENELLAGDILNIHFKSKNKLVPNFNASCEIVSKWYKNKEFRDSPLCYSFKFKKISKEVQLNLTKICSEDLKAA